MQVVKTDNNETYEVYDISYDSKGYPRFLIYKDNQWIRLKAKYFRPIKLQDYMQNKIYAE